MVRPAHPDPRVVTVWSDLGCPWAGLALHTLHAAARRRGTRLLIDHRAFPLELVHGRPTPKPLRDAEVAAIGALREELGWAPWQRPAFEYPVTMLPALEAVQAAKNPAVGGLAGADRLDSALRRAFLAESRCISLYTEILDIAAQCRPWLDVDALAGALTRGVARAAVYRQSRIAAGPDVQASPHLFTAAGFAVVNPGVPARSGAPGSDLPVLDDYDPGWADQLLDTLVDPDDADGRLLSLVRDHTGTVGTPKRASPPVHGRQAWRSGGLVP
jgi:predicted DsbA family dithiol-disulfide isomerase